VPQIYITKGKNISPQKKKAKIYGMPKKFAAPIRD
jgi:hypothetical protein